LEFPAFENREDRGTLGGGGFHEHQENTEGGPAPVSLPSQEDKSNAPAVGSRDSRPSKTAKTGAASVLLMSARTRKRGLAAHDPGQ